MTETIPVEFRYLDEVPAWPGDRYARRRREAVRAFFRAGGFPAATEEDWRFSDLDALGRTRYRRRPETPEPLPASALPSWTAGFEHRVLLVDGRPLDAGNGRRDGAGDVAGDFARNLAGNLDCRALPLLPAEDEAADWGFVAPPEPAPSDLAVSASADGRGVDLAAPLRHPFEMLNAGLFDCGFRVRVGRDTDADAEVGPVLLYSLRRDDSRPDAATEATMLHPRSLIELAPGSRLTVIEAHDGDAAGPGWTNPSTLCRLGEDAELRYVRIESETGAVAHTGRVVFELARNARVRSTVLSLGGGKSRTDTAAVLTAEGAEVELDGLFLGVRGAKSDQHTLAIHAARHTTSRQLFKNVLSDDASAVFDGKVVVAPGADKTDASQSNRNLLLSEKAQVHTRPRLEIHADDVKCAHGAAIGRLDEDALFYLRSRGLGRMDSREILVRGFCGEVVERIPVEAVRTLAAAGLQRVRESRSFAA